MILLHLKVSRSFLFVEKDWENVFREMNDLNGHQSLGATKPMAKKLSSSAFLGSKGDREERTTALSEEGGHRKEIEREHFLGP